MSPRTVLSGEAKDTIQTQLNNLKDEIDQAWQSLQQQYHDDNASIEQHWSFYKAYCILRRGIQHVM